MGPGISLVVLACLLGGLLVWAGIEDIRHREIANRKNAAIALLAPAWWWASGVSAWPGVPVQIGVALAVFAVFCAAFHFGWMGGGDVKLIGALALWLPVQPLLDMLTIMAVAGGAITIAMMAEHRLRRTQAALEIPYGVAIAIAGLLTLPRTGS